MAESINLYDSVYIIRDTRNRLKRALIRLGMLEGDWHEEQQIDERASGGFSLSDCRDAINSMGGDATLSDRTRMNVAAKKRVRAYDANLIASNIKKDVSILGVTGSYGGSGSTQPPQPYVWTYGTATAPSTTASGSYSQLTPAIAPGNSLTLRPENIRTDVDIMGVIGVYDFMHMCGLHNPGSASATRYSVSLYYLPQCPDSGYDTITERDIQIGWLTSTGKHDISSDDYFASDVKYIVGARFGKNPYDNNAMFLVLDTLSRHFSSANNFWETIYERYYVNNAPYALTHPSSYSYPTLVIDLSGATYKLFNSNVPSGGDVNIDARFLTSTDFQHMNEDMSYTYGQYCYHTDIRW